MSIDNATPQQKNCAASLSAFEGLSRSAHFSSCAIWLAYGDSFPCKSRSRQSEYQPSFSPHAQAVSRAEIPMPGRKGIRGGVLRSETHTVMSNVFSSSEGFFFKFWKLGHAEASRLSSIVPILSPFTDGGRGHSLSLVREYSTFAQMKTPG